MIKNLITIDDSSELYEFPVSGKKGFKDRWSNEDASTIALQIPHREATLQEIKDATVIFCGDHGFQAQGYDGGESTAMFYIPKYQHLFTLPELREWLNNHQEELYLMVSDKDGYDGRMWAFIDSVDYKIKTTFLMFDGKSKRMVEVCTINNQEGTCLWDLKSISINKELISSHFEKTDRYEGDNYLSFHLKNNSHSSYHCCDEVDKFHIINDCRMTDLNSSDIMIKYLKLPGKTRIISRIDYSNIEYEVSANEIAMKSITERYGIRPKDEDEYSYGRRHLHEDVLFDSGADLDTATWERVSNYIKTVLTEGRGRQELLGRYHHKLPVQTKDLVVISAPIGMHRRPTYHYVKGFMNADAIDIVELARGELLMKDMIPVDCYYLKSTGDYFKISHTNFSDLKNIIINAEVDRVSFAEWNEAKSLHPQLLKAINDTAKDEFPLDIIQLFNRVPFGALFLEHLIKGNYYKLAERFAIYITDKADNMNYVCGSLSDILPGCDPDGTSLIKVLNVTKPCFDLLMNEVQEHAEKDIGFFIMCYKAIQRLMPEGVVTKEGEKLFRQYIELSEENRVEYHCRTGRIVDIIDYPAELKAVYKMRNKIQAAFNRSQSWEPLRHYEEIVEAYFQFKDFGWDPAESQIFIEFGLGDPSQTKQMLRDRERAANTALEIYHNKIDEIAHQKAEVQYTFRKKTLKKLLSKPTKDSVLLKKYAVIMPSQIYGEDVVGSIEKEGEDMNHCVYRSYAGQISSGTYTVLYLRDKNKLDKSLVTIGITKDGRINQTFGVNDTTVTKEQAEAIVEWALTKKGMVTFRSEHTSVAPGGWARGVTIPDLPEPGKEWLKELAAVE